jgi:hypothetical protein
MQLGLAIYRDAGMQACATHGMGAPVLSVTFLPRDMIAILGLFEMVNLMIEKKQFSNV